MRSEIIADWKEQNNAFAKELGRIVNNISCASEETFKKSIIDFLQDRDTSWDWILDKEIDEIIKQFLKSYISKN